MKPLWADECTSALETLFVDGVSFSKIAQAIKEQFGKSYSPSAICKKTVRMGLAARGHGSPWTEETQTALATLYSAPDAPSFIDIAAELNKQFETIYSKSAVIAQAKRMGLKGKKPASPGNRRTPTGENRKARVRPVVAAPAALILRCVEMIPRNLTFAELEPNDCRFIFGDIPSEFLFCGHPKFTYLRFGKAVQSSYCRAHYEITKGIGTVGERIATKGIAA